MGPQKGRIPRQELQDIYDIARRAVADNEKFRNVFDSETGEPLGTHKNLERVFERVRTHFGLDETVVRR
jgi:hypothetical protein